MFHQVEDFDDVSRKLSEINSELDDLNNEHHRSHDAHEQEIESLQGDTRTLNRKVAALEDKLREIADQIAVLERRALNTSTERADFDTWTQTERDWANNALRLFEISAVRLSDDERESKHNALLSTESSIERLANAEDELVEAAKTLVNLDDRDPRDTTHQEAAAAYTKAKQTRSTLRLNVPRDWSQHIIELRSALDKDDKIRATYDAELQSCRADYRKLRREIRTRLETAVDSGAVLPVWFTTVLGPTPPAHHTTRWVKTAVDVLAYRVIYEVADQLVALGPEIGDGVDATRRSWRRSLSGQLAEYRSELS